MYLAGNMFGTSDIMPWQVIVAHGFMLGVCITGLVMIGQYGLRDQVMPETPFRFLGGICALSLPPIFFAILNSPQTWELNLQIIVFFVWAACIENLLFFFVMPKLLFIYGVSARRSWIVSLILWLTQHAFVWQLYIGNIILGFLFGIFQAVVFELTGSFLSICWGHGTYNAALNGANWGWLGIATMVINLLFVIKYVGSR